MVMTILSFSIIKFSPGLVPTLPQVHSSGGKMVQVLIHHTQHRSSCTRLDGISGPKMTGHRRAQIMCSWVTPYGIVTDTACKEDAPNLYTLKCQVAHA